MKFVVFVVSLFIVICSIIWYFPPANVIKEQILGCSGQTDDAVLAKHHAEQARRQKDEYKSIRLKGLGGSCWLHIDVTNLKDAIRYTPTEITIDSVVYRRTHIVEECSVWGNGLKCRVAYYDN